MSNHVEAVQRSVGGGSLEEEDWTLREHFSVKRISPVLSGGQMQWKHRTLIHDNFRNILSVSVLIDIHINDRVWQLVSKAWTGVCSKIVNTADPAFKKELKHINLKTVCSINRTQFQFNRRFLYLTGDLQSSLGAKDTLWTIILASGICSSNQHSFSQFIILLS